ncbi:MAG: FAD-dependent oxidoreductase [Alistipes sp.]|nr:FAD-dependent oxidoreductase [Alistipes sp.]
MKRKDFLKITALGVGAFGAGSLLTNAALSDSPQKVETPLETEGWLQEPPRQIPIIATADVVVAGGGPAGIAAAIAAAREGASVVLIEREYFLGGLWTGGLVLPVLDTRALNAEGQMTAVVRGVWSEIFDRALNMGMVTNYPERPLIDPEACKYILEQMIQEAGVQLIYNSHASQLIMSGDSIQAVIVETKSGRVAIQGKVYVDCSGDGDLMNWAGEEFDIRKHDIGVMYRIGGAHGLNVGTPTPIAGVKNMWMRGESEEDGLNVFNQTRLELLMRKRMWEHTQELKATTGRDDIFLLETPSLLGVRITRVLKGKGRVTFEGAVSRKEYDDVIGYSGAQDNVVYNGVTYRPHERPIWQIPYSALLPQRCPNLLVAGRCISFDEGLNYDAREVGTCFVTGQAAGVASALAANLRSSVQEVNIGKLQESLRKQNVYL